MLRLPAAAAASLSPAALGEQALLVRRIVALEGDEMISDLPGDEPFVCVCVRPTLALHTHLSDYRHRLWRSIPPGHAWVTRDNEALPLNEAPDSRTFGPLPLSAITGRCVTSLSCDPMECRHVIQCAD